MSAFANGPARAAGQSFSARIGPWIDNLAVQIGTDVAGQGTFISFAAVSPGSGTTSVACAVAERLQIVLGRRVLLIDAGNRAPHLHELFGIANSAGLADVLDGRNTLREAVRPIGPGGHGVMTAGAPDREFARLIDSDAFASLKTHLGEYFDHVIFDCAAFQTDASSLILARRVDGLVLVLAAEQTRWESGAQAIERLRSAQVNVIGAALNRKRFYIPRLLYKRL
jgi:Mrp family chromosome partitioning ATPase